MSSDREDLAGDVLTACRALAAYGLGSGIGGHVSIRVPGQDAFWTNTFDRSFEELDEDGVLLVGFDGEVRSPGREVSLGISFHAGIYTARPDVSAVVHTHGFWATAQSAFGRPPLMWHNMSSFFLDRVAVSPDDTFESVGPAVRPKDVAIVIPWHGYITMGSSIDEAAALHVILDYACRLDVVMANTGATQLDPDACERMCAVMEQAGLLRQTWALMQRKAVRAFDGAAVLPLITQ